MRETWPLGGARANRSPRSATAAAHPLARRQRQPPASPGGRAVPAPANCCDGSSCLAWGQGLGGLEGAGSCNPPPLGGGGGGEVGLPSL